VDEMASTQMKNLPNFQKYKRYIFCHMVGLNWFQFLKKKKGGLNWTSHTHIYPQLEFGLSKPPIEDEPPQFREED